MCTFKKYICNFKPYARLPTFIKIKLNLSKKKPLERNLFYIEDFLTWFCIMSRSDRSHVHEIIVLIKIFEVCGDHVGLVGSTLA